MKAFNSDSTIPGRPAKQPIVIALSYSFNYGKAVPVLLTDCNTSYILFCLQLTNNTENFLEIAVYVCSADPQNSTIVIEWSNTYTRRINQILIQYIPSN